MGTKFRDLTVAAALHETSPGFRNLSALIADYGPHSAFQNKPKAPLKPEPDFFKPTVRESCASGKDGQLSSIRLQVIETLDQQPPLNLSRDPHILMHMLGER